jgi:DedD protein
VDPATEQMRQTLEAEMAAHRADPAASASAPVAADPAPEAPAAGTRRTREGAAAPQPATRPARAPRTGSLWVQVYSSANGERAREIVAQLERAQFPVVLAELDRAGGTNYRVRVGPFATRPEAESAATRLRRDQRLDTWITDTP